MTYSRSIIVPGIDILFIPYVDILRKDPLCIIWFSCSVHKLSIHESFHDQTNYSIQLVLRNLRKFATILISLFSEPCVQMLSLHTLGSFLILSYTKKRKTLPLPSLVVLISTTSYFVGPFDPNKESAILM